jgi:uncharacterized membrane protein
MTQPKHARCFPHQRSAPAGGDRNKHKLTTLKNLGYFLLLRPRSRAGRYWEIDALRGVAIVMMVTYHLAYDLAFLGYYQANVVAGPWRAFARITASLFISLVGVSLALSYARFRGKEGGWDLYKRYLVRGLKLSGWGMVITLITWVYMGKVVVIFGILHIIGVATMLAYPFLSLRWANLFTGLMIIALGIYLNQLPVSHPWMLLLGLRPRTLFQVDYFPLLPWFGVVLLGVFVGQSLYPGGERRFNLPDLSNRPGIKGLVWSGRHSLAIYLVHQPLLLVFITLASAVGIAIVSS